MDRFAVRVPVAAGLKTTATEQFPLAASMVPQLLLILKSPGLVPVSAIAKPVNGADPLLVSVEYWAAVVEPTPVEPNVMLGGVRVGLAPVDPVPLKATVCGDPPA